MSSIVESSRNGTARQHQPLVIASYTMCTKARKNRANSDVPPTIMGNEFYHIVQGQRSTRSCVESRDNEGIETSHTCTNMNTGRFVNLIIHVRHKQTRCEEQLGTVPSRWNESRTLSRPTITSCPPDTFRTPFLILPRLVIVQRLDRTIIHIYSQFITHPSRSSLLS